MKKIELTDGEFEDIKMLVENHWELHKRYKVDNKEELETFKSICKKFGVSMN